MPLSMVMKCPHCKNSLTQKDIGKKPGCLKLKWYQFWYKEKIMFCKLCGKEVHFTGQYLLFMTVVLSVFSGVLIVNIYAVPPIYVHLFLLFVNFYVAKKIVKLAANTSENEPN